MIGTYAKVLPDSRTKEKIAEISNLLNISNPAYIHDTHVTVAYSRIQCDSIKEIDVSLPITAHGLDFTTFKNRDGSNCLVLLLESDELHELHNLCRTHGATHDYPEYHPHITLSYDYDASVPNNSLLDFFKDLLFTEFIVEPLDVSWVSNATS